MSKKKKAQPETLSFLNRLDNFFEKHSLIFFWITLGITLLVSIGLYDPRVSLSGDDSVYIISANNFLTDFSFPGFQGPLYPIVLAPIVFFFGLSLFPVKMFSLICMLGCLSFTFFAFRKRIPASLLIIILLLFSVNSSILYYSGQAFNEAFYMFMQSIMIFVFFKHFIDGDGEKKSFKASLQSHLWLALAILGVCLTRSVGFSMVIAVAAYFLFYKQWKNLFMSIACFLLLFAAYSLIKMQIWQDNALQFSSQGTMLLQKDPYHAEFGNETLSGFFVRFWQNSIQYLSNGFYRIMGFGYGFEENSIFRMLFIYIVAIAGLCFAYIKNKYLFFSAILAAVFLGVTFFILQVIWNQERLIIPVSIFVLLTVFGCFYYLLSIKKLRVLQFLLLLPFVILFIQEIDKTAPAIKAARKITDAYSNLTPDWENYLRASAWVADNLPKESLVACRKPGMSAIYAKGRSFHGIYTVPTGDVNVFFDEWKAKPEMYAGIKVNQQNNVFFNAQRDNYNATLQMDNRRYWIVEKSDLLVQQAVHNNISINSYEEVRNDYDNTEYRMLFYADTLLNILQRAKVTHILTANLRMDPERKTGNIISTVERYAYYIQEKYPTLFELIHMQGTPGNEEAQIIKINWEVLKEAE